MATKTTDPEVRSRIEEMPNVDKISGLNTKNKKNKRRRKWIILGVIVAVIIIGFLILRSYAIKQANEMMSSAYITETVQRRDIAVVLTGTGTLEPADSYSVTSLVTGEILSAEFEEGDMVQKDELLYRIDPSDLEYAIERGQLALDNARLNYNQVAENLSDLSVRSPAAGVITVVNVDPGDNVVVGQTLAQVRDSSTVKLRLPFVASEAANMYIGQPATVTLYSSFEQLSGTVTKISGADEALAGQMIVRYVTIELENPGAISNTSVASAMVGGSACVDSGTFEYISESYILAETSGKVASVYIDEGSTVYENEVVITLDSSGLNSQAGTSRNTIRDAELALENQIDQLENYNITSPISGTIVQKDYKEGDKINTNSGLGQPLCVIFDLSYLTMTLNVDELDIAKVKVGQSVYVTAEALEGREYEGVVTKVNINGTTAGGVTTYPVTIRVDKTDELYPGMHVDVEIEVERRENVLSVPIGAVERGNIILSDNAETTEVTPLGAPVGFGYIGIELGVSDDDYIEIVGGLSEGDNIAYMAYQASNIMEQMMMMNGGAVYYEG